MAWYLANKTDVLDQFATGGGLTELRAAYGDYPALKTFLDEGMTKNVPMVKLQLEKLASRTDSADVKDTASGLAKLMDGQEFVAITQGFGFEPQHETEKEDESTRHVESLREAGAANATQRRRDKYTASAARKIQKLVRARFRAQRKALLDSATLRSFHVTLDRTGNRSRLIPGGNESSGAGGHEGRASLSHGNRSRTLRGHVARPRESPGESAEHGAGSQGETVRRVTGSVDAPLTDAGRKQAHDLKGRVGDIEVYTAPNSRSRETGRIVNANAQDAEWMRPWGVGRYEGMSLDAARDAINRLVTDAPDESPGVSRYSKQEGDTFNAVSSRLIAGTVAQRKSMKPGARVLNITSGRALHIIHAAAKLNFRGIDKSELVSNSDFSKPGDLFVLTWRGLEPAYSAADGQYFAQHGETDWNEGVAASEALREADDPERATLEAEISTIIGQHVYNQTVTAADGSIYADAITDALQSGADNAATMLGTVVPHTESFVTEYLKDAGFSQLTGEIDKTTVDRVASAMADAYEAGEDFNGVVSAIKSTFADMTVSRAQMIAQTELNDAFNQSVMHFGREAGAAKKSWQTDLAPCLICIANALDGEIDFDEDFESGDDAPPAHPNCNCSLMVHA